jgi:hypothetical protein
MAVKIKQTTIVKEITLENVQTEVCGKQYGKILAKRNSRNRKSKRCHQ